jgi:hypothetical protein
MSRRTAFFRVDTTLTPGHTSEEFIARLRDVVAALRVKGMSEEGLIDIIDDLALWLARPANDLAA